MQLFPVINGGAIHQCGQLSATRTASAVTPRRWLCQQRSQLAWALILIRPADARLMGAVAPLRKLRRALW